MRKLLFILFGILAFSAYSQVTISEDAFNNLPKEIQTQLNAVDSISNSVEETSESGGIGKEIGTAVSETLKAVEGTVIRVADSNVGQVAIGITMWKLLWKDVVGIIVGLILLGFSCFFGTRAIKKPTKEETDNDSEDNICCRRIIAAVITVVFFIASICCIFG